MNDIHAAKPAEQKLKQTIDPSRRSFLLSTVGAGAVVASTIAESKAGASAAASIPSITIPSDVTDSLAQRPKPASFEGQGMSGAEVFAKLCHEEELAALFCCPGNYTVINAIAAEGVPSYGGRCEGSMCAAADGFSRATGEVTACSGTEGPGLTNMIMNIASAAAARTPLLVLASNMQLAGDDRETFIQTGYQQPLTTGMKKYGKRLIAPDRVWEYGAYAFRNLKSGVPGPVHLDFPGEVARARFTDASKLKDYYGKDKYRSDSRPCPSAKEVKQALDLISRSERPLLIAGQGVFQNKAWEALLKAAEKNDIAVVTSGPTRGHFPDDHRLSAALSPDAVMSADLVIFVGQYCMPSPGEYRFNPDVKTIRVHPVQEDLGRNWPLDLGIVSCEKPFLEALSDLLPSRKRDSWVNELAGARKSFEKMLNHQYEQGVKYSKDTNHLHPAVLCKEVHDFFHKGDIDPKQTVMGGGGWTIGVNFGRWQRAFRPGQGIVCPYQYGAIGPDLAMMIGASAAVQRGVGPQAPYKGAPTVCVSSDAGIAYSLFELDTASKYKLPVIGIIYNNDCWGMWPSAVSSARSMHLYLFQQNLRYDQMAEGLGARGEYVRTPEELREALKRSYQAATKESLSTLINCQGMKEFTSARRYPPGVALNPEPGCGAVAH
ncbi:MAG TPA: thiamine pyrophosphate-binding protein [Planctomycetaceae bacterium]|jgi:thiamine pyrophosphate-dependent acetolactate synthase large subunit-like protein|nr:thiamine pyrophosphate-binding protein [Planctomycetaceae bacterium]